MNTLYRWLIIAALFIAALVSYSYGITEGVFLFVIAGFVFELTFWFSIFGKKKPQKRT